MEKKNGIIEKMTQVMIPVMTITVQVLVAVKLPEWSILVNLLVQPFWIYSTWKSYKQAGQIGLFITSIIVTIILIIGVINWWFIS